MKGEPVTVNTFRAWSNLIGGSSRAFQADIERRLLGVEDQLDHLIDREEPFIRDAGRYVLKSGGKRLRPLLLILSARMADYAGWDDVFLATVVEYIHTATLIHDDIIDGAQVRRGRKALNRVWGNHTAVLLGDYFYTKAMDLTLQYGDLKILRIITHITTQMLKGEVLGQVHSGNRWMSESEILGITIRKTACLFSGCCQIGAILAELPGDLENRLSVFGLKLGIAFQIADDLLDYTGTTEDLGKPALQDLREGKVTLPFYYLVQRASPEELQPILRSLDHGCYEAIDPDDLQGLVRKYDIARAVHRTAEKFAREARSLLADFPVNDAFRLLDRLIQFIIDRRW